MVLFPSLLDGLARSVSIKKGRNSGGSNDVGREAAETMAKDAKRKELLLTSSGILKSSKSNNFASVSSKKGQKGINQDSTVVWEEFGGQEDMIFCGIFDGHGPWGHVIAKKVRNSVPPSLLCNWQETLAFTSLTSDLDYTNLPDHYDIWKQSYLKTYAAIDEELKHHPTIDSFCSGTTALTAVKQGENLMVANAGDSRAVLAVSDDDGKSLVAIQLSVDFKPSLPEEAERIRESKGRVSCLEDEPGVYRVWRPNGQSPGLALSRALGDYCVKDFGLISVPHFSQTHITNRHQFLILATDGVWDVISNQEAVEIVSATREREKSAKRLVESAAQAWKYNKRGIAKDDISAICLFFHPPSHHPLHFSKPNPA